MSNTYAASRPEAGIGGPLLASVFQALAEGVIVMDAEGVIVDCNVSAVRILGISHAQVCGRSPRDPRWRAINEDGSDFPAEKMPAMITLRTGKGVRGVLHGVIRPDGRTRWLSVSSEPVFSASGELAGVVASMADITSQYRQMKRIRAQQEALSLVLDSLPCMVFYKDEQDVILDLNKTAARAVGKPRKDIRGHLVQEFVPDDKRESWLREDRRVIESGVSSLGVRQVLRVGG